MKNLILFSVLLFLTSCSHKDEKKYVITKFDLPIYDTIKPLKGIGYTTKCIEIKGYVDDSILVSFGRGNSNTSFYLTKKIDFFINPDYYGESDAVFVFDPYKAKKGKLELTFSILGSSQ